MDTLWDQSFQTHPDWRGPTLEWEKLKSRYPVSRFLEHGREIRDLELLLTIWEAYWQASEANNGCSVDESGRGDMER